jgi:hypothetical protein
MTVEDRCREWTNNKNLGISIKSEDDVSNTRESGIQLLDIKECRKELPAMTFLEDLLVKSLIIVIQAASELFPDTVHIREVRLLVTDLLLSKEIILLSYDDSGNNVQVRSLYVIYFN